MCIRDRCVYVRDVPEDPEDFLVLYQVYFFDTRWVALIRSSKKNMEPYQTLQTHSHSSNTPIRLPERCSVAPSKKIFGPHAHLAGIIFIFQMELRSKDIIIEHHYWHPHDVIAGLRAKNGAVGAVSCAWMWNRDFPYKMPRFSTFIIANFVTFRRLYVNLKTLKSRETLQDEREQR